MLAGIISQQLFLNPTVISLHQYTYLINKSLATGIFPKSLKRAKILPIFKNKDKLDITNYRPISLLPVISKVYEFFFYNRLYNYFFVNKILSSSQFGFKSGASTEHALLKFSDEIQVCTNSRWPAFCWKWTQRSVLLLLLLF